ncbi:MAG: CheW protein [Bacillales bacterium]|jgi:purine-binding chemotaxis protein CheW|nr:CheW protein [Bacillales bacterium]
MLDQKVIKDYKALIFKIAQEEYGIDITQVVSIERMQAITSYPNRPAHVLGVTTIREIVTPVIDLRSALTGLSFNNTDDTRMIIVQVKDKEIGLIVDDATDVTDISLDTIQYPKLFEAKNVSYLNGISKLDDRVIILLDIEKLLEDITNLDELKDLKNKLD